MSGILGINSGFSTSRMWTPSSINSINHSDLGNISGSNATIIGKKQADREVRGFNVVLHNVPEALQWIAKKIEKRFNVKVFNSDIPFKGEELKGIYDTLAGIPSEHLKGVETIVKNRSLQLNLQDSPPGVFSKMYKSKVYGAYDKENKRVFIFELDSPAQVATVLKHEIGHAVHSYNIPFEYFFLFVLKSGWDVAYHEQQFVSGNSFYNMVMKKFIIDKRDALKLAKHFNWDSIRNNKDIYGKYVLSVPEAQRELYAYKNPYETFASLYEKTISK